MHVCACRALLLVPDAVHELGWCVQAKPVVVLPLVAEQPWNAPRVRALLRHSTCGSIRAVERSQVVESGAGLMIQPGDLATVNGAVVRDSLQRVMSEPSFKVALLWECALGSSLASAEVHMCGRQTLPSCRRGCTGRASPSISQRT